MRYLKVMVVLGVMMATTTECEEYPMEARTYCGRRLLRMLDKYCEVGLVKVPGEEGRAEWRWQWLHEGGRDKRQVVADCCFKPCTIDALRAHCGGAGRMDYTKLHIDSWSPNAS